MDKKAKTIVQLQEYLITQMKYSNVTMQVASEYLEYANKSSVSRTLAKDRMPAMDAIKLLALLQQKFVSLKGITLQLVIRSDDMRHRMKVCEELFEQFQNNVFQSGYERKFLPLTTWNTVASKGGYNDGESARRAWVDLNTPLSLVLVVLELTGQDEITASTKQGDSLTIGIKQKRVAGPLTDNPNSSN